MERGRVAALRCDSRVFSHTSETKMTFFNYFRLYLCHYAHLAIVRGWKSNTFVPIPQVELWCGEFWPNLWRKTYETGLCTENDETRSPFWQPGHLVRPLEGRRPPTSNFVARLLIHYREKRTYLENSLWWVR